jgi:hypothetical protein
MSICVEMNGNRNRGERAQTLVSCEAEEGEQQVGFHSFMESYGKPSEPPFEIPAKSESYVKLICDAK